MNRSHFREKSKPHNSIIRADASFGSAQLLPKQKLPELYETSYEAVFYLIDHVNDRAYPILAYKRPRLEPIIKGRRTADFKQDMRTILDTLNDLKSFMHTRLDALFDHGEKELPKADYDRLFQGFIETVFDYVRTTIKPLEHKQTGLFDFYAYETPYELVKSSQPGLHIFIDHKTREAGIAERADAVLKRRPQSVRQPA